jgi:hypothetical protein
MIRITKSIEFCYKIKLQTLPACFVIFRKNLEEVIIKFRPKNKNNAAEIEIQ